MVKFKVPSWIQDYLGVLCVSLVSSAVGPRTPIWVPSFSSSGKMSIMSNTCFSAALMSSLTVSRWAAFHCSTSCFMPCSWTSAGWAGMLSPGILRLFELVPIIYTCTDILVWSGPSILWRPQLLQGGWLLLQQGWCQVSWLWLVYPDYWHRLGQTLVVK